MTAWDEIRARDTGKGASYYGDQQFSRLLTKERLAGETNAQQEQTQREGSGQAELDALALEIQATKVNVSPKGWAELVAAGEVSGPQPREQDQPLAVRNRAAEMRLAEVFRKRAGGQ